MEYFLLQRFRYTMNSNIPHIKISYAGSHSEDGEEPKNPGIGLLHTVAGEQAKEEMKRRARAFTPAL